MRKLWKIILYTITSASIFGTLYISNIPVAAKTYDQSYLPMSGTRTLSPREYLYKLAGDSAQILDRIIQCESGWRVDIKNKSSSATGLAQFINSTWVSTRIKMGKDPDYKYRIDPYEHIDALIFLWDDGRGSSNWLESRPCWGRYL